jgi:glyoxylase-like metal-dependent hydrolase (beta-lactamase superfamily II)
VSWTDLGDGIRVRHSAAFQMTSTVLLDRDHAVVVDPGVLPSELDDIARVVGKANSAEVTLILTHPHWDHVVGRAWFPDAHTIAHDGFTAVVRRDAAHIDQEAAGCAASHGEPWTRKFTAFRPDEPVSGIRFLKLGPWKLVLRDAPGHSQEQLTVHLPEPRVLLAADMLSDVEIPGLCGPPALYRATLEPLLPLAEHGAIETLVPGHGTIARGSEAVQARFHHDLDYLRALADGIRSALADGQGREAAIERVMAIEYTGKNGQPWPMAEVHRENAGHAWNEATRPAPARRHPAAR